MSPKQEKTGLEELLLLKSLDQKKAKYIFDTFDITTLKELEFACRENRLSRSQEISPDFQEKLLKEIWVLKKNNGKHLISSATEETVLLEGFLKQLGYIKKINLTGQLRRKAEIISEVSFLVCTDNFNKLAEDLGGFPNFDVFLSKDQNCLEFFLKTGLFCSIHLSNEESYNLNIFLSTGSKEHLDAINIHATKKGIKIKSDGLYLNNKKILISSEEEIYSNLELDFILPERREGHGEIAASEQKRLPPILVKENIKGVFHCHTQYSDGVNTLEEMAAGAEALGLEYIGISEHSASSLEVSNGLKKNRVLDQFKKIEVLQKRCKIKIFKGIESDILIDGKLDYEDALLKKFDFVIGSVHEHLSLTKDEMTARVHKAILNPFLDILGHPTGRMMPQVLSYEIDLPFIIKEAVKFGAIIELNSNPRRLDLDWRLLSLIAELNGLVCVNPDAHSVAALEDYEWGVYMANKAMLEAKNIVNTLPASLVLKSFKRNRAS